MLLDLPLARIVCRMRDLCAERYQLLQEFFHGTELADTGRDDERADRLHPVSVLAEARLLGRAGRGH